MLFWLYDICEGGNTKVVVKESVRVTLCGGLAYKFICCLLRQENKED